jgi:hypothetical protein
MALDTAKMIGQMAFSFLPGSSAVELGVALAMGQEVGWSDLLGASVDLIGPVGKIAGRFVTTMAHYAGKGGRALKFEKYGDDFTRVIGKACNCFVGGTLVDTPAGPVPIEQVAVGDEVLTRDESDPNQPARPGKVTHVFQNMAPVMLWIVLANGQPIGTTPGHEVWTCQEGWTWAGHVRVGDAFLDPFGTPRTIVQIVVDPTPTIVYNLEVDGTFTYFVESVWVHNNSCDLRKLGRIANAYGHSFEHAILEMLGLRKYVGPRLRALGTNFVPDVLQDGIIGEIKSSEYVYMTPQLTAMAQYAKENGLIARLYTATGHVSDSVRRLFDIKVVP